MKDIMNFIEGIGSILNITPTIGRPHIKPLDSNSQEDYKNLANDWQNVGNDIRRAMNYHDKSKRT